MQLLGIMTADQLWNYKEISLKMFFFFFAKIFELLNSNLRRNIVFMKMNNLVYFIDSNWATLIKT